MGLAVTEMHAPAYPQTSRLEWEKLTFGNSVAIPAIAKTKNMRRYREDSWNGPSGRPENGIQPHGSSFFGNRGRIDAVAHAADQTATFGQSGGMASVVRQRPVCSDMTSASR